MLSPLVRPVQRTLRLNRRRFPAPPFAIPTRKIPNLAQRCVPRVSHDDMIQHLDSQNLAGADHLASYDNVPRGWKRVSTRVVMGQDDGCGSRHHGQAEHLPWMD